MATEAEELLDLRKRVEVLEILVLTLRGRIENLEAAGGGPRPGFHMGEQDPIV